MNQLSLTRSRRRARIRAKIKGTAKRPRLAIFRSSKYLTVQLVDDLNGKTLLYLTDRSRSGSTKPQSVSERVQALGSELAHQALSLGINKVVFDRGGYRFHGRVKTLAEAARQAGLKF
ncbi:MAG: 50S ribosomal protein L18 [Patescibacteria group bacterium]